jgi:hypothetical protein
MVTASAIKRRRATKAEMEERADFLKQGEDEGICAFCERAGALARVTFIGAPAGGIPNTGPARGGSSSTQMRTRSGNKSGNEVPW